MEQHFADPELLGVAKAGDPGQFVGAQIREHRVHLQNDRKFGRFTHGNAFHISSKSSKFGAFCWFRWVF